MGAFHVDGYDIIVVGAGFSGAVVAERAAANGHSVLLLERRSHIGGNMHDHLDEGVFVHDYGPHIMHTSSRRVYDYLVSHGSWTSSQMSYAVEIEGKPIPAPFGFLAIYALCNPDEARELKAALRSAYPGRDSVPILELLECEDRIVSAFARFLYERNYVPYAAKQWGMAPCDLTNEVIGRMPVILSDRRRYYADAWEMLPTYGYASFFSDLLSSPQIDIELGCEASSVIKLDCEKGQVCFDGSSVDAPIVFTGPLHDVLKGAKPLPYRSLCFEFERFETRFHQECALLAHPQRHDYLRTTDYNLLAPEELRCDSHTVVSYEYPAEYNPADPSSEPYYPVLTPDNIVASENLRAQAMEVQNFFTCGRLSDYRYYNMDQAIMRALDVYSEVAQRFWGGPNEWYGTNEYERRAD